MSDTKICPFCAEEIKEAAFVCKHCGRDLDKKIEVKKDNIKEVKTNKVYTTQRTAKSLKLQSLLAFLLLMGTSCGFCGAFMASVETDVVRPGLTLFLLAAWFFSLVWLVAVRIMIWWNHK